MTTYDLRKKTNASTGQRVIPSDNNLTTYLSSDKSLIKLAICERDLPVFLANASCVNLNFLIFVLFLFL